ncbi:hypothetical protein GCM10023200_06560 [Actinomycetospora chlora]|uniref:Excalibur calcium-binding domain-containing protein n=1 Tax=Actinomycetospora chlora TaxID=663608 RepID=A0ABP9A8T7_9PSEU
MRGRRGSRSAAVVLAGCVGLAVMAPGLALAAEPPSSTADCVQQFGASYVYDATSGSCEQPASEGSGSTGSAATPGAGETSERTTTTTTPTETGTAGTAVGGGATETGGAGGSGATGPALRQADPSSQTSTTTTEETTGTPQDATTPDTGAAPAISGAALTRQLPDVQEQVADALDVGTIVDGIGLPGLPDVIPQPDTNGNFDNVNDACLNAVSQLQFPAGTSGLDTLSSQLQGFCTALDPTTLTGLLGDLIDLLKGLIPSLPTPPATIPHQPPHTVSSVYWGYWYHQYDVDCPELTYEEANAILAADPSDPFRLDGDHDGVACEENAHGDGVAYVEYVGYPVGGVATGDGSTGTGASGVEVALAAATLAGLGLSGLVLVRRFARQG